MPSGVARADQDQRRQTVVAEVSKRSLEGICYDDATTPCCGCGATACRRCCATGAGFATPTSPDSPTRRPRSAPTSPENWRRGCAGCGGGKSGVRSGRDGRSSRVPCHVRQHLAASRPARGGERCTGKAPLHRVPWGLTSDGVPVAGMAVGGGGVPAISFVRADELAGFCRECEEMVAGERSSQDRGGQDGGDGADNIGRFGRLLPNCDPSSLRPCPT